MDDMKKITNVNAAFSSVLSSGILFLCGGDAVCGEKASICGTRAFGFLLVCLSVLCVCSFIMEILRDFACVK